MPDPFSTTSIQGSDTVSSQVGGSPVAVVDQLINVAQAVGRYGLATVIFAFPVVMGCFGLYFLSLAVGTAQLNMGRMIVGMFTTVFGSGLTILLLWVFTRWHLWEQLRPKKEEESHKHAKAA